MWPAMVKFVGKAHGRVACTNVWMRNGAWSVDGEGWLDMRVRFPDSLAAAAKMLWRFLK